VQTLNVERTYPGDFGTARNQLSEAKEYLAKKWLTKKAIPAAESSLMASKSILKQYYLDGIAVKATTLRNSIMDEVNKDADTPLKDYLPEIDSVLDRAEKLAAGHEIVSLDMVLASLDACIKIQDATLSYTSDKLESDVSFDIGSYELSERGISAIEDNFLRKIISDKEGYKDQYPDSVITVRIKVVGYTDQVGFKNRKLIAELTRGAEDEVPGDKLGRRQFLNQRLSELRAKAISQYLRQRILSSERGGSQVNVEEDVVGKGETMPPGIIPSNYTNDPQRRVCKIYSTISYMAK